MGLTELQNEYADLCQYVDVEDGLNRILNNKEVYGRLLGIFAQDTHLSELRSHIAAGDREAARGCAHKIKGVAANLSLPLVRELSTKVEGLLKQGSIDVPMELAQLEAAINTTVKYIEVVRERLDDIDL